MMSPIENSVVRIFGHDASIVGAGFLIKDKIILTCAHVIGEAVGEDEQISLDFPRISPNNILKAIIKFKHTESDIAILELCKDVPVGALGINLGTQDDLWGHPFQTFGFPDGHDSGVWASGVCRRKNAKGLLQIEDIKGPGYNVETGFSGAPVWDEDLNAVVGMVAEVELDKEKRSAFAIPINMLLDAWPELKATWGLDDPWTMINEDIRLMTNDSEYEDVKPLIDSLKHIIRNRYYEHTDEVINISLNIIKKLVRKRSDPDFSETFERIALGFISPDWIISESEISDETKDDLIKCIIRIFADNRDKLIKTFGIKTCVPIVLVVMNKIDANGLKSRIVFDQRFKNLIDDFEKFEKLLEKEGLDEWTDSYDESPPKWRPFNGRGKTIEELIRKELYGLKYGEINPIFTDIQTINEDCYRPTLKKIRETGCVVIMDVVSMQHPIIQQEFRRSLLDAFPCNLVAKIAPNTNILEFIKELSIIFESHADLEFYKRCNLDRDRLCKRIHNERDFEEWFGDQVKKLPIIDKAKSAVTSQFWETKS